MIDFSAFLNDSENDLPHWSNIWVSDNIGVSLESILNKLIWLPHKDIQLPIVISYLCTPSAISRILPIALCYGQRGTGKSTIGLFASKLYECKILTASDTFASIRNDLTRMKYEFPESQEGEKNFCLIWDDIDQDVLINKPDIYRMLKSGYNRATDTIQIAGLNGANITFRVFSLKITSSIQPLHLLPKFPELARRILVIYHAKNETESKQLIDLNDINWTGFNSILETFWDEKHCKKFLVSRKKLNSVKNTTNMSSEQWTISVDIMSTALTLELFNGVNSAVSHFENYWKLSDDLNNQSVTPTSIHLKAFIEAETTQAKIYNEAVGYDAMPYILEPAKLKRQLEFHASRGELDIMPKPHTIQEIMRGLGWRLSKEGWVTIN